MGRLEPSHAGIRAAMSTLEELPMTSGIAEASFALSQLADKDPLWKSGAFTLKAAPVERGFWLTAEAESGGGVALRAAHTGAGDIRLNFAETQKRPGHATFELSSDLGAYRVTLETSKHGDATCIHYTTYFRPLRDLKMETGARDLYAYACKSEPLHTSGKVHCSQRGLRTGVVYASSKAEPALSVFYLQNFTKLAAYFDHTVTTPSDTVGGAWPELGYASPANEKPLHASIEYAVSDVYLLVSRKFPQKDADAAGQYLDYLAEIYLELPKVSSEYHHWPAKAHETVLHLSHSPKAVYRRFGKDYITPYVGDETKPPESMVQLVVLVALLEYEDWSGRPIALTSRIRDNLSTFFNESVGSVVRWLPGDSFEKRNDPGQNHDAMDSWYLYHVLFNLTRLTKRGDAGAKRLLKNSLAYAIRVARRFAYRWPIFFKLSSLEIIRAEASPSRGGENDVAGLYALTMLHAYEIFQNQEFLDEAKAGIAALDGLGFTLAYQMNTTLFAAEAALRLYTITGEERYKGLSEICMANAFNNVFLWECEYGFAQSYHTFFGLFPLQDAPYFAAYEELEALAKFREYFRLGAGAIRPSLRLLMAEYCKNLLPRAHYYFPSSLPNFAIADEFTNGKVERTLEIPLEDLRDGRSVSGQVGQETYGAGLALVCTTRHYRPIPDSDLMLFCDYPSFEFKRLPSRGKKGARRYALRVAGDPRATCSIRFIPIAYGNVADVSLSNADRRIVEGCTTVEGHRAFEVSGDQLLEFTIGKSG
jgi:hypothetical protein